MYDIKTQTKTVYEAHAEAWDKERSRILFEKGWLDRLLAFGTAGDCILDVGCGAGSRWRGISSRKGGAFAGSILRARCSISRGGGFPARVGLRRICGCSISARLSPA